MIAPPGGSWASPDRANIWYVWKFPDTPGQNSLLLASLIDGKLVRTEHDPKPWPVNEIMVLRLLE